MAHGANCTHVLQDDSAGPWLCAQCSHVRAIVHLHCAGMLDDLSSACFAFCSHACSWLNILARYPGSDCELKHDGSAIVLGPETFMAYPTAL